MRKHLSWVIVIAAALACNTLAPRPAPTPLPTVTAPPPAELQASQTPAPTRAPTATPALSEVEGPTSIPQSDLYIVPGDVLIHPDPQIYSGDKVSFEVFAHDGANIGLRDFPVGLYAGAPGSDTQLAV